MVPAGRAGTMGEGMQRAGRVLGTAALWLTVALLVWAPIPLGSNRPWAWALLAVWVAVLLAVQAAGQLLAPAARQRGVPWVVPAAVLTTVPVWGWALLQTLPATTLGWLAPNPFWVPVEAQGGLEGLAPLVGLDAAAGQDALMRLLTYAGIFWVVLGLAQDGARARLLLRVVLIATVACAVYGLVVQLGGWQVIGWLDKVDYVDDATGTFINRNNFATYVNIGLMVCLALLAEPFLEARGLADVKRIAAQAVEHLLDQKSLLLLGLCVLAMAALQSHSRGGLLSAGIAVIFVVLLLFLVTRPRPLIVACVVAATVAVGAGLLSSSGEVTLERLGQVDANYDLEVAGRLTFWQVSLDMVADRPWQGYGYGSFESAFAQHRDERFDGVVDKAHNTYIEHLVELGIPATVALYLGPVLLFGYCVRGLFARQRNQVFGLAAAGATVLVALHSLVDFSLQIPAVAVTFAAVLAIGVAQSAPSPKRPAQPGASLRD